jgi:uncharacterized protein YcfJ
MKKTVFALALVALSSSAMAYDFSDTAQVISSEPIYQQSQRQQCWDEQVQGNTVSNSNSGSSLNSGTIIGGIAGGLLGHQVGGGNGKTAATAVGAVTGALVGNNINNGSVGGGVGGGVQTVRRCNTVPDQRISGYRVTYQYNGRQVTTTMQHNPESTVQVGVGIIN